MNRNRLAVLAVVIVCAVLVGIVLLRLRQRDAPLRPDEGCVVVSPQTSPETPTTELAQLPVEESVLAQLPAEASADARAVAPVIDSDSKDVIFYQRKVLTDNLAKLSAPDTTLDSISVRLVLCQSIALSMDAQGRGIHRTKDEGVKVKPQPGQQHFMYNGGVYVFEPNEFPEWDAFTRNRKAKLSDAEAGDMIARVRKRGEVALASLPQQSK